MLKIKLKVFVSLAFNGDVYLEKVNDESSKTSAKFCYMNVFCDSNTWTKV